MKDGTAENVRNHRDINLITTEARSNYLVSEPNSYTTKIFSEYSLAIEIKIKQILKKACLFRSINIRIK